MGEFVQQAQHVARHSGPSGAPHLLCTSKILLSTIILLAIHIYQPGMDAPSRGEGGVPRPAPLCEEGGVPRPAP